MQKRQIWSKLAKEIHTDEVIVITGPRQVGKTTTLKWLLDQIDDDNKIYFDLGNIVNRELFEVKNYDSLINELQHKGLSFDKKLYIVLDEIQLLPNLPSIVKYLYDHYKIKFFLSGSSSYYIKNRFSESMAGRKVIYEMLPLTFQEFLDFRGVEYKLFEEFPWKVDFSEPLYLQLKTYYQEYVRYGGLPRVVLTQDVDRKRQLTEEIFSSYIDIDVQALADFKSTKDLRQVIKLLASRIGNKLNVSEIANITGLSRITIDGYIEFLEQTYLIATTPAFSRSEDTKAKLQKKVYFVDTGIANVCADLSSGSRFENTVRHQLVSWAKNGEISYFSDREGEIDFIFHDGKNLGAVEVKQTPTNRDLATLERRALKLKINLVRVIGKEPIANFSSFMWGGMIG